MVVLNIDMLNTKINNTHNSFFVVFIFFFLSIIRNKIKKYTITIDDIENVYYVFYQPYYNTKWCYCQHHLVFFVYNISKIQTILSMGASKMLYQRVRDLREDHDKNQKDIADYLHMQLTVYQRYERGERELPLWAAIRLADYYNVTLDYLVGRTSK